MRKLLFILFFGLIPLIMAAQTKIKGKYDSKSKLFIADEKEYWIDFFENGVARISKNGYMGLIDSAGNIICEPKYDIIYNFENNVAKTGLNEKYGLINNKGKELAYPQFDEIKAFKENLFIVENNGYGILKKDGTMLVDTKYELLESQGENIIYYDGENIGIIDQDTGKESVAFKSTNIDFCRSIFSSDRRERDYDELLEYSEGLTKTFKKIDDSTALIGFMDNNFKTVIEPQYDKVTLFEKGYARVMKYNKWGLIDKSGNIILPLLYEYIMILNDDRFLVTKNDKHGVVDKQNNIILPVKYNQLRFLFDDLYATHNEQKWGVIDEHENIVLNYEYDMIVDNLAAIHLSTNHLPTGLIRGIYYFKGFYFNKDGLINKESIRFDKEGSIDRISLMFNKRGIGFSILIEGFPDFLTTYTDMNMIENQIKKRNGKYDYRQTVTDEYEIVRNIDEILTLKEQIQGYQQKYKYGIINKNDSIVVPMIFERIYSTDMNLFIVRIAKRRGDIDERRGVIDINNNFIIEPVEHYIQIIGSVIIVNDAVYDFTGKMLIPPKGVTYTEGRAGALKTGYNIVNKRGD
jgi:hypothetical protein